jgi:putative transposase
MTAFESELLECTAVADAQVHAWCILPNHYHVLVTVAAKAFSKLLGQFHGRTSFAWNGEENARGRQIWCNYVEREMRGDGHFWATINYINHNPVKHGYTKRWQDWPWSSATSYLKEVGHDTAARRWTEYPIDRYGEYWDIY